MQDQLLKTMKRSYEVTASGDKYVNVVGSLFNQMRSKAYEDLGGKPLINLKAEEVYFEEVKVNKYTERFLFLFWPREKKDFTIKARIMVVIDYLDLKEEDIK